MHWGNILSEVIEHIDSGDGEKPVLVGDASQTDFIKLYQDVYRQITGRSEQIRKRYSNNLLIEFSELEQLNYKILQLCDVHNVVAKNEVISIFHDKERKEQFTSFEKFRTYNSNAASPSVSVVLKYNFSIIPSRTARPEEYVVTIRLMSRVAVLQEMEEDAPAFIRGRVVRYLDSNTAEATIDYADYVVARGFLEAFDEWIKGCKTEPNKAWLDTLRRWSHLIPHFMRISALLLLTYLVLQSIPVFFSKPMDLAKSARFLVIYSSGIYIILSLVHAAGEAIEFVIDSYPILSYLKLNRGDSKLIDEFQGKRTKLITKFILASAWAVVLGVIATKLEKLI